MRPQENSISMNYSSNDDIYPTEIIFASGLKVRISCSEDGKQYLRVDESTKKYAVGLSPFALSKMVS